MNLEELIKRFLLDVCGGKNNQTEEAYRLKLRRLLVYFGPDSDPNLITTNDLDNFKYDLQQRKTHRRGSKEVNGGLSQFTIRTVLVTVRFLFSWATMKKHIPMNPMGAVRIKAPPNPNPKSINPETVYKLLNAAATNGKDWERARNVAILYLLRDTGARAGGIVGIQMSDLDLRRGFVMVTEKGDRTRPLPICEVTISAIRLWTEYRVGRSPKDEYLFSTINGNGITYRGLNSLLRELSKKAGVEKERHNLHSFRHAYARDLLLNGAELSQVSALCGHTDTRVTSMYYARWNSHELKRTHNKFSPVLDLPEIKPEFERVTQ